MTPPPILVSPSFGLALMACGSFGVVRLAAARPNFKEPTNRSHPTLTTATCFPFQDGRPNERVQASVATRRRRRRTGYARQHASRCRSAPRQFSSGIFTASTLACLLDTYNIYDAYIRSHMYLHCDTLCIWCIHTHAHVLTVRYTLYIYMYIHTHMYLRCDTFCIYIYTYTRTCTCIAIHSVLFFWLTHVFLQNDVHSCEPGKLVVVKRHVSRRKRHRVYLNVSTCVNRYIYREIFFDLTWAYIRKTQCFHEENTCVFLMYVYVYVYVCMYIHIFMRKICFDLILMNICVHMCGHAGAAHAGARVHVCVCVLWIW